jgi:hypothetical protein
MHYIKYLLITNIYSQKIETNFENKKYNLLLINNFFINQESILKIKTAYEKEKKTEITMKDFYEDLELIIYIYFIIKNNFTINIIGEIVNEVLPSKELNTEENLLFKMLIKINVLCELIYKNIKFDYLESNEDYDDTNINYNCLIIEGSYKKNMPHINVFNCIKTHMFISDLKKLETKYQLKELKIYYYKSSKILNNKIDSDKKTFKIILHTSKILPLINYQLDMFTFDNSLEANKNLRVLNENPSMTIELFKNYLNANKIKYTYQNINVNNQQLTFQMNYLFNTKNIKDKFTLEEKLFFVKSKKYSRETLKNFQITQEEIYILIKKKLLNYMKDYKPFLEFLEKQIG